MTFPLILAAIALAVVAAAVVPPAIRLYRRSPREAVLSGLAGVAFVLGAVPVVRILLFRSMVEKDYRWAIRGPAPFDQLGSGPWWLWTLVLGAMAAGVLWGLGLWLLVWRAPGSTARGAPRGRRGT